MIAYLFNLIVGQFCKHKWVKTDEIAVYSEYEAYPIYRKYILQCQKCGDIKRMKV